LGPSGLTAWDLFLDHREAVFNGLDSDVHEFLAQALTYAALHALTDPDRGRLVELFKRLEKRQPKRYRLPHWIRERCVDTRWDIVLDAARGDIAIWPKPSFGLMSGLLELVSIARQSV
jgi:hypothetical protein